MIDHKWKFGDWGRFHGEEIVRFVCRDYDDEDIFFNSDGCISNLTKVEYLPECTGFDWKPKPVEPTYQPFANAAEFKPFRKRWWRYKDSTNYGGGYIRPPSAYSDKAHDGGTWERRFKECEFEDGMPFGISVEPSPAEGGYE